ncbi:VOC family protein [Streptomyces sp. NPDC046862]|uniref:VOC family protein n=1 Tax=Streptomyces sp. NPDC046862 TaxID=3154603 RepID=UPI0034535F32
MSELFNAFEISPVPPPGPDAVPPAPFRGIYGMPMFVTVPTRDLAGSTDFWVRGLGFFEFFSIPGQVVHLRKWAFQDVLLVPAVESEDLRESAMRVSFACVLSELAPVAEACNALRPGCATAPFDTPWTTRDVEVVTPEQVRVVFTAAKPADPGSEEAKRLAAVGIVAPTDEDDNVVHDG